MGLDACRSVLAAKIGACGLTATILYMCIYCCGLELVAEMMLEVASNIGRGDLTKREWRLDRDGEEICVQKWV